jgi:hypothetical protein
MGEPPDSEIVGLSKAMLARAEELGGALAELICRDLDFYRSNSVVTKEQVSATCTANMIYVFRSLAGDSEIDATPAEVTGTQRAAAGIPLAAVMAAYRVGFRFMWEKTIEEARRRRIPAEVILAATSNILIAQDMFTQAMTSAYRQQATVQILGREEERSALVEALLFHQITDTQSLWEAADLLRLPSKGPYVVVAAQVPGVGRLGLPEIASRLDVHDIRSAWRLLPDLQVGIVYLRRPETLRVLIETLGTVANAHVGISPPFDDLADTSDALRFARLAINGNSERLVAVFDESPLALAAVSAPEAMARIGKSILGQFDDLPPDERRILVDTFEAWVEAGGSANDTAAKVFCHPNTVRHRLHRIEEKTGRTLTRPKDIAELCLAFEIDRRATH